MQQAEGEFSEGFTICFFAPHVAEILKIMSVVGIETMGNNGAMDLTSLTKNQKTILKVLADAEGEALWGVEVRRRLREDYGVELTKNGMNAATRRTSRYPRHMVVIKWVDSDEIEGSTRHASHRLKQEYISEVRKQLQ